MSQKAFIAPYVKHTETSNDGSLRRKTRTKTKRFWLVDSRNGTMGGEKAL